MCVFIGTEELRFTYPWIKVHSYGKDNRNPKQDPSYDKTLFVCIQQQCGSIYINDTDQNGGLSLYQIMSLYKTHACNVVCRRCDKHRALNLNWTPFYPILSKLKNHFCRPKVFQTVLTWVLDFVLSCTDPWKTKEIVFLSFCS